MKKFIFIVGDGKRCGKDYVFKQIAKDIVENNSVRKITLADNVFKILKDLKLLNQSDLENKTFEYRDYMGYLGQKWNNLHKEWTDEEDSIFRATNFLNRLNPNQAVSERISNFDLIDSYMEFYKKYLLKTKGYNLWCELADYKIDILVSFSNPVYIITDMRQMREYEYFNFKYPDAEKFVVFVNSNAKKVDVSVEAGNSGLFSQISCMPDRNISRVELNNHKLNKLITDSIHVYNSVDKNGEYENKWEDDLKSKLDYWFRG